MCQVHHRSVASSGRRRRRSGTCGNCVWLTCSFTQGPLIEEVDGREASPLRPSPAVKDRVSRERDQESRATSGERAHSCARGIVDKRAALASEVNALRTSQAPQTFLNRCCHPTRWRQLSCGLRAAIAGDTAAATAQAAAPSAITCTCSATNRMARAASFSDTTIDSVTHAWRSGHIVRGPSGHRRRRQTTRASRRTCSRGRQQTMLPMGRRFRALRRRRWRSGAELCMTHAAPARSPPPPSGATTASTSGKSSRISRPIVPLPLMK